MSEVFFIFLFFILFYLFFYIFIRVFEIQTIVNGCLLSQHGTPSCKWTVTGFWWGNVKEIDHLQVFGVGETVILK